MWISVSCYGLPPGDFFVGLGVQASKETARKRNLISYYPSGGVFVGPLLGPSVLRQGMKAEPNYFSSLALNITDIYSFFLSLYYYEINFNRKVNFETLFFPGKRWDFQHYCSITFERVMSTHVFYIHIRTHFV